MVFFRVFFPFIFAVIVAFPAFFAVILPFELMVSTEGFEERQVMPFTIFAFVLLLPPMMPGNTTLQDTVRVFVFFTFILEGACKVVFVMFALLTSRVCI